MNIFFIDKDPILAARFLCDKHVVKMITESCQLLSTDIREFLPTVPDYFMKWSRHCHNHPCGKYIHSSKDGFIWLVKHLAGLIDEYDFRYGKKDKFTRARKILNFCQDNLNILVQDKSVAEIPQAIKNYPHMPDPIQAYRNYYKKDKINFAKWTRREKPNWF